MRGEFALIALLAAVASAGEGERAAATPGRQIYLTRCAPCHGQTGGGDGPAAGAMTPRPRNFRDAAFWGSRTPEQLRAKVRQGGAPASLMPPFADMLSDREIDAVVEYLRTLQPDGRPGAGAAEVADPRGG